MHIVEPGMARPLRLDNLASHERVHLLNIPHDVRIDAVPLRGQQVAPHIGKQQRAQDLEAVDRARKSGAAPSTVVPIAPQRWAAASQTAATSGSTRRRMRSALKPIRRGGRPWRIATWKPPAGTGRDSRSCVVRAAIASSIRARSGTVRAIGPPTQGLKFSARSGSSAIMH
jgi:hypothetical protein